LLGGAAHGFGQRELAPAFILQALFSEGNEKLAQLPFSKKDAMEKRKKRRYQGSVKVPSTSIRMGKVNYTAYMTHHSGKLIFLAANTKHNPKFACTCILPGFLRCVVGAGSLQYQYKAI